MDFLPSEKSHHHFFGNKEEKHLNLGGEED